MINDGAKIHQAKQEINPYVSRLASRLMETAADAEVKFDSTGWQLITEVLSFAASAEQRMAEQQDRISYLEQISVTDELTGILNRRGLKLELGRILAYSARHREVGVLGFIDMDDFKNINGEMIPIETHFKLKADMQETYNEIGFFNEKSNAVVIIPFFTSTAYWEPGFYTYYRNDCDTECLTKKIDFEKPFGFSASDEGFKILKLLNYNTISDFELAKNPDIINKYDKVIVLHNEYVRRIIAI